MLEIRHPIGRTSDVKYSTFDGRSIECRICDIRSNRMHTSTPYRVKSTERTISNASVKRLESTDYLFKQILWTLSISFRVGESSSQYKVKSVIFLLSSRRLKNLMETPTPNESYKDNLATKTVMQKTKVAGKEIPDVEKKQLQELNKE